MSTVNISAADINKLRQQTGAGMMDCRKALTESNGDFEAAIDWLRKKGQKVAANRSDREAKEGVVIARSNGDANYGVVVTVSSETDFVAKNNDFIDFANAIVTTALQQMPGSVEALKALHLDGTSNTVSEKLDEMVAKIGERIDISRFEQMNADTVVAYNHGNYRIGVLVGLNQKDSEAAQEAGKDVAMQIAAMNPLGLDANTIPADVIERERNIVMETMKADPKMAGKPDEMVSKIAEGKLNAFFKENTLLAQAFVKDNSKNVGDYVKGVHKELEVTGFRRVAVG